MTHTVSVKSASAKYAGACLDGIIAPVINNCTTCCALEPYTEAASTGGAEFNFGVRIYEIKAGIAE
jgi:hypothetical protein